MDIEHNFMTLFVLGQDWLSNLPADHKESTYNKYDNILKNQIYPRLGEILVEDLSYDVISLHVKYLLEKGGIDEKGLSGKTVRDAFSVLKNILRYSARKYGTPINLNINDIRIRDEKKEMRVLSLREQEKLCSYISKHMDYCNLGILITLYTGLRVGEMCGLRWQDIDCEENTLHVQHTLQRIQNKKDPKGPKTKVVLSTPKTANSNRIIPLTDELINLLKQFKGDPEAFVLSNSTHAIEPRLLQRRFCKVLKECSINHANYHALRHTFATRCIECGFDIKSLSEILGHADVSTTMNKYVHSTLEFKRENMRKLLPLHIVIDSIVDDNKKMYL